jgi:hypothetical protein
MKHPRLLFICKKRYNYDEPYGYGASYGLLNSCRFLCNALNDMGVEAKLVEIFDNNGIDKEVHHYKPTHVFIEALWVVPEKFPVLIALYPHIHWNVRIHSNTPFLANEGMAIDWIEKYAKLQKKYHQFHIAPNSLRMVEDLQLSLGIKTKYAPNIYQPHRKCDEERHEKIHKHEGEILHIGCFGAIRPMKNQLIQAMAAITFANELGKPLHFHINYSRIETNGSSVYRNLVALFKGTQHKLIHHDWMLHEHFLKLIDQMDLGLQVSLSETFNIVAADFVYLKVPIVASSEIEWMNCLYKANPTHLKDIVAHMWKAWLGRKVKLQVLNNWGLDHYNNEAREVWRHLLHLE